MNIKNLMPSPSDRTINRDDILDHINDDRLGDH